MYVISKKFLCFHNRGLNFYKGRNRTEMVQRSYRDRAEIVQRSYRDRTEIVRDRTETVRDRTEIVQRSYRDRTEIAQRPYRDRTKIAQRSYRDRTLSVLLGRKDKARLLAGIWKFGRFRKKSRNGTQCLGKDGVKLRGRDSSVGIATRYGLDSLGIEARWRRDFLHLSRPALEPKQPPIQWVPG